MTWLVAQIILVFLGYCGTVYAQRKAREKRETITLTCSDPTFDGTYIRKR